MKACNAIFCGLGVLSRYHSVSLYSYTCQPLAVRKPKAINLARWKDGKNCELHRLPPVGKGSGKCRTARLVLEAGSARLGMRLDVKVRTVSESAL